VSGEARSYYGRPVLKEPVWTPEIPVYFWAGGMAGGSAALAWVAGVTGREELARRAWAVSAAGIAVSPPLLISDLGRPARFLYMLRMFKVTSPMSVGSWILAVSGAAITGAAAHAWTGLFGGVARVLRPIAGVLGLPLATYTGALIANTSVPVWHEARRTLPFLFGAGAAASAGAAVAMATPVEHAGPARRLAVGGAAVELMAAKVMEKSLGELGEPYHVEEAGRWSQVADVATILGAATLATAGRRSRAGAVAGGAALLAGALAERWSVYRAGFQSARDPKHTVGPQRERIGA
jgi:formate-dependent nitrite reductase membrane component NrfD